MARLSVVFPNYNHARFLPYTVESIMKQSRPPDELIIVDDASTDDSLEILRGFAKQYPAIKLIEHEKNKGVVESVNEALESATGDYIQFSSADDVLLPGFFEKSMNLLDQFPQAGLCSGFCDLIDEKGKPAGRMRIPIPSKTPAYFSSEQVADRLIKKGAWFVTLPSLFNLKFLRDAGGLNKDLGSFADGFISRVLALKHGACFIPEPFAAWRRMSGGFSSAARTNPQEILRIMNVAKDFMRHRYKALFNKDLIRVWEREEIFEMTRNTIQDPNRTREALELLKASLPGAGIVDQVFFVLMALMPGKLKWLAMKIYLRLISYSALTSFLLPDLPNSR